MSQDALATVAVAVVGMAMTWAVWVSVSVFKLAQEIALLKQEINILVQVKEVLDSINLELKLKHKPVKGG